MISFTFLIILACGICLAVAVAMVLLWLRFDKSDMLMYVFLPLFALIVAGVFSYALTRNSLYVVTGANSADYIKILADAEYTRQSGEAVTVTAGDPGLVTIVNESDMILVLQEVLYDTRIHSEGRWMIIAPNEVARDTLQLADGSIDYLFDDEPPNSMAVDGSEKGAVRKSWLWAESLETFFEQIQEN